MSCLGWIKEIGNRKSHKRGNVTYKGKKIIDKGKRDGRKRRRCHCTKPEARTEQATKPAATKSATATESRFSRTSTATFAYKLVNFKTEFSGKPEEDAEAHLLCSNDWMNARRFIDSIRVQRFCLTLLGEASLWFQS